MVRIFPPEKLEMGVRMSGMRGRMPLLDCTEPFTARTRRRERRVICTSRAIATSHEKIRRISRANQAQRKVFAPAPLHPAKAQSKDDSMTYSDGCFTNQANKPCIIALH